MKARSITTGFAAAALALGLTTAANAQALAPAIAQPLQVLLTSAQTHCASGNPQACQIANQLNVAAGQLMQAQSACNYGNPQACALLQQNALVLQAELAAFYNAQQQASPVDGLGLSHQQRMAYRQQQFNAHQQRYQAQQRQNDINHQQFIDWIRK